VLLLLELIVLSGTNCSKLETLHTVLLLLTCFAFFSAQLDQRKHFLESQKHIRTLKSLIEKQTGINEQGWKKCYPAGLFAT
jgi:hypothetical protein